MFLVTLSTEWKIGFIQILLQESILKLKPYFHPRTYKALSIGVISFGFDEQPETLATIAVSLSSTRKALRMFRKSFNDLRGWHVLQGSRKRECGLLSLVGFEINANLAQREGS
jgi:hypothetical protein